MPSLGVVAELYSAFWVQKGDVQRMGLRFRGGRCVLSLTQQENPFILQKPSETLFLFTSCSTGLDDSAGGCCFCRVMSFGG